MIDAKDIIEKAIKEARERGRGKIISRDDIYNAIFKAGIELVVEWVEEQGHETFRTGYYPSQEMWQAQKKVWGVKNES